MILGGSLVPVIWGYQPITRPAIEWSVLSDGNWSGDDRTSSEDTYKGALAFKGTKAELLTLETVLAANRENLSMTCSTGEEIFGADVSYSSALDVTVTNYGGIKSVARGIYSMPLQFQALSPTFTGSASISDLRLTSHKFSPNSAFSTSKTFSLENDATYNDSAIDPGVFTGVFKQTTEEMKVIRRYLLTTARTAAIAFPYFGVSKPFGQRMGTGPFNCKIISWRDLGRKNFIDWELEITFARVI